MSISSEIQNLIDNLANAYTSLTAKGATIPVNRNMDNLATCIDSVSGGGADQRANVIDITSNGTIACNSADESVIAETPPVYNVTLVGNVVNTNGILSGFSSSNYALVNQSLTVNNKPWELHYSFIKNSTWSDYPMCSNDYGFGFTVDQSVYAIFIGTGGNSWDIVSNATVSVTTQTGVKQYIKCGWTGTEYYIDRSLDGETYTRVYTKSSTTSMGTTTFKFGASRSNGQPLNGTVDLNDCKLYHDGTLIWEGVTRQ